MAGITGPCDQDHSPGLAGDTRFPVITITG